MCLVHCSNDVAELSKNILSTEQGTTSSCPCQILLTNNVSHFHLGMQKDIFDAFQQCIKLSFTKKTKTNKQTKNHGILPIKHKITKRANAQMVHVCHTLEGSLHLFPLYNEPLQNVLATSCHFTTKQIAHILTFSLPFHF